MTEFWTCKVCRFRLNPALEDGRLTWKHGPLPEDVPDHEPVPVPDSELKGLQVCDFCGNEDPIWLYDAEEFGADMVNQQDGKALYTSRFDRGWAACEGCKLFVDRKDLRGLADRVMAIHVPRNEARYAAMSRQERRASLKAIREEMMSMWRGFLHCQTGVDGPMYDGVDGRARVRALERMMEDE